MRTLVAILLGSIVVVTAAQAQQTVFRDAGGRTVGTATRNSQGTTTVAYPVVTHSH